MNSRGLPDASSGSPAAAPTTDSTPSADVAAVLAADGNVAAEAYVGDVLEACKRKRPYTLQLETPVKFGSEEVTALTFNRPNASMLDDWQMGTKRYGDYLALAARLCGVDLVLIKKLDIEDAHRAVLVASFFSKVGLPTGGP